MITITTVTKYIHLIKPTTHYLLTIRNVPTKIYLNQQYHTHTHTHIHNQLY